MHDYTRARRRLGGLMCCEPFSTIIFLTFIYALFTMLCQPTLMKTRTCFYWILISMKSHAVIHLAISRVANTVQ